MKFTVEKKIMDETIKTRFALLKDEYEEISKKMFETFFAEEGNRTLMELPPPDFESGASTSFTTSALFGLRDFINFYIFPFCSCNNFPHFIFNFSSVFNNSFTLFYKPTPYIKTLSNKCRL